MKAGWKNRIEERRYFEPIQKNRLAAMKAHQSRCKENDYFSEVWKFAISNILTEQEKLRYKVITQSDFQRTNDDVQLEDVLKKIALHTTEFESRYKPNGVLLDKPLN